MSAFAEDAAIEAFRWQRTSPALARAAVAMEANIRRAAIRREISEARLMLREPWRIQRAIYGAGILGPFHANVRRLLSLARRRAFFERERGRSGHWTFDANRLLAYRAALLALRFLRRKGIVSIDDAPIGETFIPSTQEN